MRPPRVIGMMTARDEEDILAESLTYAASRYDHVLFVDCGSVDRTADIARQISRKKENVHFLGSIEPATSMQVKRHIWNSFRHRFRWMDWWCFADADEFVDERYREVIQSRDVAYCDHVIGEHVNFYYKVSEYKADSRQSIRNIRAQSVRERRKFYRYHTKQIRFFRNLPWLRWNFDAPIPNYLSYPSEKRVQFLHYQYRDPAQVKKRIEIRKSEYYRTDPVNLHWCKSDVYDALSCDEDKKLLFNNGSGFVIDQNLSLETKQAIVKTILKYSFNICAGLLSYRFKEKRFENVF